MKWKMVKLRVNMKHVFLIEYFWSQMRKYLKSVKVNPGVDNTGGSSN